MSASLRLVLSYEHRRHDCSIKLHGAELYKLACKLDLKHLRAKTFKYAVVSFTFADVECAAAELGPHELEMLACHQFGRTGTCS